MDPDVPLVRFPDLLIERRRGSVRILNRAHATSLDSSPDIVELLDFFVEPRTLAELFEAYEVERSVVDELIRQVVLVPAAELPLLRTGLLAEPLRPLGRYVRPGALADAARPGGLALFGVPSDRGAGGGAGARHGPEEIRRAFPIPVNKDGSWPDHVVDRDAGMHYRTGRLQVFDLGDVQHLPSDPLEVLGARVAYAAGLALDAGLTPIMLGGDHSITWHALPVYFDRFPAIGVLHFDAHSDLYDTIGGGLHHGNPFRLALARPELRALRQVGLRGLELGESGSTWQRDRRVSQLSSRAARRAPPEAILDGLPPDLPWYVSVDVDVLSPQHAPETGTPVIGGLSTDELLERLDVALARLRVVGMDVVEVAHAQGPRNAAATAAARCVAQLVLSRAPSKRVGSGWLGLPSGG